MQNILLLGKGISNNALHQFMIKYGIEHDYFDLNAEFDYHYNLIIKGPGIYYQEEVIQKFISLNKTIITDIEFIYWFLNREYIAVTGGVGKTTTVMLIDQIINSTYPAISCGNIGYPMAQAALDYKLYRYFILELSSFQLKGTINFTPKIAVMLNLGANHLDYHQTIEDYHQSKFKITVNQTEEDYLIYNCDDLDLVNLVKKSKAQKISFSLLNKKADAYISGNYLYYQKERILNVKKYSLTFKYNLLASVCVAKVLNIANVKIWQEVMKFKQPVFRFEHMGKRIINDAKSTNIAATIGALKELKNKKIYLICGGYDRGEVLDGLIPYINNLEKVFAYGMTKEKIKTFFEKQKIEVIVSETLQESTLKALLSRNKQYILYSPMFASYDQYQSYKERGKEFKEIIDDYYRN